MANNCINCGQLLTIQDQNRHEGVFYCPRCNKYTDYNALRHFSSEQLEFMTAKAENDFLMESAKERNADLYKKVKKLTDKNPDFSDEFFNSKIMPIWDKIEQRNKEIGLYDSHKRLGKAEFELIKWFRLQIRNYCIEHGLHKKWAIITKDLFDSKFLQIDVDIRRKVLNLAKNYTGSTPGVILGGI